MAPKMRVIRNPLFSGLWAPSIEKLFSYYPHPATHELFLNFKNDVSKYISIFDISGKLILRNKRINRYSIEN